MPALTDQGGNAVNRYRSVTTRRVPGQAARRQRDPNWIEGLFSYIYVGDPPSRSGGITTFSLAPPACWCVIWSLLAVDGGDAIITNPDTFARQLAYRAPN